MFQTRTFEGMLRETKRYGATRARSVQTHNIRTPNESEEIYKGKDEGNVADPHNLLVALKFRTSLMVLLENHDASHGFFTLYLLLLVYS